MRSFTCPVCSNLLVAENSVCVVCGTAVGFSPAVMRFEPVAGRAPCANLGAVGCNWLVDDAYPSGLCLACRLTRTRPADADTAAVVAWATTEAAKRRLVYQLIDLGLPVAPRSDDPHGLAFDLLSSALEPVVTGHADGVVTIDLAEGEDAHREAMRVQMGEPYRTVLGHLRHEVGHHYWQVLVAGGGAGAGAGAVALERFRALFGDERADYAAALQRHYAGGPPTGWAAQYVSAYATAHPWEDWAETFAHYLHIRDSLQTAAAYGMVVTGPDDPGRHPADVVALPKERVGAHETIHDLVATWLPLTFALNAVNRSMGAADLYPFVLAPAAVAKLGLVHDLVVAAAR